MIKTKCHVCNGNKVVDGHEKMTLYIEKGTQNGSKIDFKGGARDY